MAGFWIFNDSRPFPPETFKFRESFLRLPVKKEICLMPSFSDYQIDCINILLLVLVSVPVRGPHHDDQLLKKTMLNGVGQ